MKVQVEIMKAFPHRLQVYLPAAAANLKELIESLKHVNYHGGGHYSMMYREWSLPQLRKLFGERLQVNFDQSAYLPVQYPKTELKRAHTVVKKQPRHQEAVDALERWIKLKQYSWMTLKSYKSQFVQFLLYYNHLDPKDITKEQIEEYLYEQVQQRHLSESTQNQIINAIKCYYEKVLGRPRELYTLVRPKKKQSLPQVLSPEEIRCLLEAVPNLKHQTILMAIYSGGLRLGEVVRLRTMDIRRKQRKIFIKGGKNKKDRYTLLSDQFMAILEIYLKAYRPAYWLFEGQHGGAYSPRSVQQVFRRAANRAGVGAFATLHTLRHSFATHLLEQGVDIRYIQELLGHAKVDTTMIYTHVSQKHLENIVSPLDQLKVKSIYTK